SNLLDNAIKYAPQGRITVRAGVGAPADEAAPTGGWASRPPAADGAIVRVEVQDHGPGIPQQEHPRVWEKLFRGSGVALLNAVRGCGIGLAVVRALVEAHGGRVGLESALGQGTRFWFELPGSAPPPGEAAAPAAVADATGSIGAAPAAASAPEARGA
ncbi:MAG: ATP-binding protein, partial [Chloroflexota bacterium]|nr:ATP-binding protein [Chloroflexota bacterium]